MLCKNDVAVDWATSYGYELLLVKVESIGGHYIINEKYYWYFISTWYWNLNIITLVACICHILPSISSFS